MDAARRSFCLARLHRTSAPTSEMNTEYSSGRFPIGRGAGFCYNVFLDYQMISQGDTDHEI